MEVTIESPHGGLAVVGQKWRLLNGPYPRCWGRSIALCFDRLETPKDRQHKPDDYFLRVS